MNRSSLAAAVAPLVLLGLLAGCSSGSKSSAAPSPTGTSAISPAPGATYTAPPPTLPVPGTTVSMSTAPGPWPPPAVIAQGRDSAAYVAAAGLPYGEEMLRVHYHAHLDVIADGKALPVPAYLGFVAQGTKAIGLSALHTHDASGVIHIENAVPATFLLGQVFTEWGVRFSATCVGGYCAGNGKELAVYVDGQRHDGDPAKIVLTKHEEIAVEFGDTGKLPAAPASYKFPNGE